jgi:hypothetical protein
MNDHIFKGSELQRGYGQRGHGMGGLFSKFINWATPIAKQNISEHVPKFLESGAKLIGEQLNQKLNSKSEALINKNDDTVKNYEAQLKEIANPNITKDLFRGAGLKSINRKKKTKNYIILKKSNKKKDIFD